MDIYEVVWKTLFVIKAVEKTGNENIRQLVSAANDAYASHESGLTQRTPDVAKALDPEGICRHGCVPAKFCYICFPPRG